MDRSKTTTERVPKPRITLIRALYIPEVATIFTVKEAETHIEFFKLTSEIYVE